MHESHLQQVEALHVADVNAGDVAQRAHEPLRLLGGARVDDERAAARHVAAVAHLALAAAHRFAALGLLHVWARADLQSGTCKSQVGTARPRCTTLERSGVCTSGLALICMPTLTRANLPLACIASTAVLRLPHAWACVDLRRLLNETRRCGRQYCCIYQRHICTRAILRLRTQSISHTCMQGAGNRRL